MKKLIIIAALVVFSVKGFSQTSYLYQANTFGNSLIGTSYTNNLTGVTSYYSTDNSLGLSSLSGFSYSNGLGNINYYSTNSLGSMSLSGYSSPNIGGGYTLYAPTQLNVGNFSVDLGFSPTMTVSPSYGGNYNFSTPSSSSYNVSGYYSPSTGVGNVNVSSKSLYGNLYSLY